MKRKINQNSEDEIVHGKGSVGPKPSFSLSEGIDGPVLSEAEQREWERERKEREIARLTTPELLRYFTSREVRDFSQYFPRTPSTQTGYWGVLFNLSDESKEFLTKELKGRRIIELGNKGYKDSFLQDFGAESYEGCDPKYDVDGLTYLLRQPDESAIVTSFGVLEDGVLYGHQGAHFEKYQEELGRQIYRVTPKDAITFHGLEYTKDLEKAGFVVDDFAPQELQRADFVVGRLAVLRKK